MNEERNTNGQRRRLTAQEKVAVLREHFIEKIPVSQICDKHGISPALFYRRADGGSHQFKKKSWGNLGGMWVEPNMRDHRLSSGASA